MEVCNQLLNIAERDLERREFQFQIVPDLFQASLAVQQFQNTILLDLQSMILQSNRVFDDLIANAQIIDLRNDQIRASSMELVAGWKRPCCQHSLADHPVGSTLHDADFFLRRIFRTG